MCNKALKKLRMSIICARQIIDFLKDIKTAQLLIETKKLANSGSKKL